MPGALDGKVALVTGSGGGLGREHALALARAGARVVVNDVGMSASPTAESAFLADAVVAQINEAGGEAIANYDSVASYQAAGRIVGSAGANFGRLDIVVNNASVFHGSFFDELEPQQWDDQIAVHLTGAFNVCKHALPIMVNQHSGRIINTTSGAAFGGIAFAAYASAKAALIGLTYALACEYWREGITVNAVAPSAATRHRVVDSADWFRHVEERGFGRSDAVRPPPPEYVPPIVVYLASDSASQVSGRIFAAAGGTVAIYPHPAVSHAVTKGSGSGPWTQEELEEALPSSLFAAGTTAPNIPTT